MSTIDPWLTPPGQVAGAQRDANALFSLMHDVLAAEEARQRALDAIEPAEQRSSERRAFSCLQLLAPFDGERMPSQAEFAPQRCHDLSPSAFVLAQSAATTSSCHRRPGRSAIFVLRGRDHSASLAAAAQCLADWLPIYTPH